MIQKCDTVTKLSSLDVENVGRKYPDVVTEL